MPGRGDVREYRGRIPAEYRAVDQVLGVVAEMIADAHPDDRFRFRLALREALVNAVRHGCRLDPRREVAVEVRIESRRWWARVADGGEGFDWERWLGVRSAPSAEGGRGLRLLRLYADEVRFNERGNELCLECRPHQATPEGR